MQAQGRAEKFDETNSYMVEDAVTNRHGDTSQCAGRDTDRYVSCHSIREKHQDDVESLALVDTVAHTLPEAKANTVDSTLVNVRAEALINKLGVTLLEAESDTCGRVE